ncbi:uncharacterized protein LOC118152023 [Callithrix jacchus]
MSSKQIPLSPKEFIVVALVGFLWGWGEACAEIFCYSYQLRAHSEWARTNTRVRNLEQKVAADFLEPRISLFSRLSCFRLNETLPRSFWSSYSESLFCKKLLLPLKEIADNVPDLKSVLKRTLTFLLSSFLKLCLCLRLAEGSRSRRGQIKALWTRVTSVLVVHLRAVERKTVLTGGLWLLEPQGRSVPASPRLRRIGGGEEHQWEGREGARREDLGMGAGSANETCREDLRLLQPAGRLPLSAAPFPDQREKPSSQSRCSQSPRPSRPCAGPFPAVATSTTSVPLNRFLLHVNTYYRWHSPPQPGP